MLYLTYNINMVEGMGAIYQRFIGLICICKYYNFIYIHTPPANLEHIDNLDYLFIIENFFQFDFINRNIIVNFDEIIEYHEPTINDILNIDHHNKNSLVKITLPFNICDINIKIYELGMPLLRNIINNKELIFYKNDTKIKIAIHIRRGDVSENYNEYRYNSLDYFVNLINYLKKKYINCNFYLFTQIDHKNENEFDIFNNDPSIIIKANEDLIDTINHMIYADILVLSKSSLSYVAGLYNKNIVYYTKFWHPPLSNWININNLNQNIIENFSDIKYNYSLIFWYMLIILFFIIIYFIIIENPRWDSNPQPSD